MEPTNFVVPENLSIEHLAGRWSVWLDQNVTRGLEGALGRSGLYDDDTISTVVELAGRLDELISQTGDPFASVDQFVGVALDISERRNRWATLRIVEKHHRLPGPALQCPPIESGSARELRRVLTGPERGLVRQCSLRSAAKTAIVGALDSLLVSGELQQVYARNIVLDHTDVAVAIRAEGTLHATTNGYPAAAPRDCEIAPWARAAFTRLVAASLPEQPLFYGGRSTNPAKVQSAILMNVNKVLTDAGLSSDPTVKPLSVRNTAARAHYERCGLEDTATALGHRDFNFVAREIDIMERR